MGSSQSSKAWTINTRIDDLFKCNIVDCKYDWIVEKFRDVKFTVGQCITSEKLKVNVNGIDDEWEIVLYPGGYNERTADFLSVWLRRLSVSERLVQFTCEIWPTKQSGLEKGKAFVMKTINEKLSLESILGWSAFCKRSHILEEDNGLLNEGNLLLKCTLQIFDDKFLPHPDVKDEDPNLDATQSELSENFSQLLRSRYPSDVTFEINGELLHSHKAILSARSKVFRTMFDSKLEKDVKKINIKDISKDTFMAMLEFIYSGKHTRMEFDTSIELYYAADKYELKSLQRICSSILASSLNIENAVQIVALANQHSDNVLQDICVNYIARNASVVQKRPDWLHLMTSSPTLANAVFQSLTQLNDKNK